MGEHEGVHYYAMQYIEGQSLDTVLRRDRRGCAARPVRSQLVSEAELGHMPAEPRNGLLTAPVLRALGRVRSAAIGRHRRPPAGGSPGRPVPRRTRAGRSRTFVVDSPILGESESHYFRSVARLGMQAAEALAYAHRHGVLHRDIKPANLLLDLQGTVWVTDFGLAKAEGTDELTSPGDVVGTLRYMAPERFHGKADPRSDIYSLGLTLYEMLTLEPAFTASHRAQLIHAILHDEPPRPRKLDPQIPRDLETIVLKAIAKDPVRPLRDADELAAELGRFVEGRPILSRRVSLARAGLAVVAAKSGDGAC